MINSQKDDDNLGVFAVQILSAKSWYHGKSIVDAEGAISEMIEATNNSYNDLLNILAEGASKVQQTVN